MKYDIELDYTSAFNMFAMLGLNRFLNNKPLTDPEWAIVQRCIFGFKELKWEALVDQMQDDLLKNILPKLMEELVKRRKEEQNKGKEG